MKSNNISSIYTAFVIIITSIIVKEGCPSYTSIIISTLVGVLVSFILNKKSNKNK